MHHHRPRMHPVHVVHVVHVVVHVVAAAAAVMMTTTAAATAVVRQRAATAISLVFAHPLLHGARAWHQFAVDVLVLSASRCELVDGHLDVDPAAVSLAELCFEAAVRDVDVAGGVTPAATRHGR